MTSTTSVTFPTSGTLATTSQIPTLPVPLASGGTNANLSANNGGIFYSTGSAGAILAGTATAQQLLLSGASTTPQWSTFTIPLTAAINTIFYASSANVLAPITPANSSIMLSSSGGVPAWGTTLPGGVQTNITSLGTIAVGTWQASLIGSTYGGTGVNNGSSTITIGGNVTFSGANTFTGTLTGNTSVTFPTSGTLATTSQLTMGTVTSVATSGLVTGGTITASGTVTVTAAVETDMEAATSTTVAVVPAVVQNHPGVAKAWAYITSPSSSPPTISASYNVTSIVRNSTGVYTLTLTTGFSSSNYAILVTIEDGIALAKAVITNGTTFVVTTANRSAGSVSDQAFYFCCFGDQ